MRITAMRNFDKLLIIIVRHTHFLPRGRKYKSNVCGKRRNFNLSLKNYSDFHNLYTQYRNKNLVNYVLCVQGCIYKYLL